jgi:hypothetical protein
MIVEIDETGIPDGVLKIVQQLPHPSNIKPGEEVTLKFADEFIYLTGLVLLGAWRKALPGGVKVNIDDRKFSVGTQRLLTNTGFREIIETGHETPSVQKRIGRVPLQPITNQFTKEATVNDIVSIFYDYEARVQNSEAFKVMVSELCENVLAHSELSQPGYICARVLEQSGTAEIAIADSGVGIKQSYLNGTNPTVKERIAKGASPLQIALDGLNSSKPQPPKGSLRSYYGFGLYIIRRLIEENEGQLFILLTVP